MQNLLDWIVSNWGTLVALVLTVLAVLLAFTATWNPFKRKKSDDELEQELKTMRDRER